MTRGKPEKTYATFLDTALAATETMEAPAPESKPKAKPRAAAPAEQPSHRRTMGNVVQLGVRVSSDSLRVMDTYITTRKLEGVLIRNYEVIEALLLLLEDPEITDRVEDKMDELRMTRAMEQARSVRRR